MKYLFLLLAILPVFSSKAQVSITPVAEPAVANPVNWTFDLKKTGAMIELSATATIQPGWHVFTTNPGGDGLLIPTELTVNELKNVKTGVKFTEEGEIVARDIEGIGKVNFYETTTTFRYVFPQSKTKKYTGFVIYQVCNDKTCLAPVQVPFSLTLK